MGQGWHNSRMGIGGRLSSFLVRPLSTTVNISPTVYKSRHSPPAAVPDAMSIDTLLGLLNLGGSKSSSRMPGEISPFDEYVEDMDNSILFSNVIYNTEVVKEAFEGAFFNPAHPDASGVSSSNLISKSFEYPSATSLSPTKSSLAAFDRLMSPPDPLAQLHQFEQSFWRLDTLKQRRRAQVEPFEALETTALAVEGTARQREMQPEEYERMLQMENEGQKTGLLGFSTAKMTISGVFKKTLLVSPLRAVEIEAQIEAKTGKAEGRETEANRAESVVFDAPKTVIVLDKMSLRLCALGHVVLLAEVLGCKVDYAAKRLARAKMETAVLKAMIERVSDSESMKGIDQSGMMNSNLNRDGLVAVLSGKEDPIALAATEPQEQQPSQQQKEAPPHLALPKEWAIEEDAALCGVVASFRRRQVQLAQKISAWIEANNLQGLQAWTRQRTAFECENPFWQLVAKELSTRGKKRTGTGCRNRWLLLQRSRM